MQIRDPRLLTRSELAALAHPRPVGDGATPQCPFHLELHASPLVGLVESAAADIGVYEFMGIRRPGDLLRYLWVDVIDIPGRAPCQVRTAVFRKYLGQTGEPRCTSLMRGVPAVTYS